MAVIYSFSLADSHHAVDSPAPTRSSGLRDTKFVKRAVAILQRNGKAIVRHYR